MPEINSNIMAKRTANIKRKTRETDIALTIDLDGSGKCSAASGVGFLDHMFEHLARHGMFDLKLTCKGDIHVDDHHTVEDIGIVLGEAICDAIGDKKGIRRYGFASVPMDESLAQVSADLSGRPLLVFNVKFTSRKIGTFDTELVAEFCRALSNHTKMNLHVTVPYGRNSHHIAEAIFKALAKALRIAIERDPRQKDVPSTKGKL